MALDVLALLHKTGALLQGHFRLSSGLHSPNYVQCALLLEAPRNAKALGEALAWKVKPMRPQKIVSPALGGLVIGLIARSHYHKAVDGSCSPAPMDKLACDDIQYNDLSRLKGESSDGTDDVHFRPVEQRQLRLTVGYKFCSRRFGGGDMGSYLGNSVGSEVIERF